jgi:hypothetical protein
MLDRPEETARLPEKMARCRRFIRLAALGTFSPQAGRRKDQRTTITVVPTLTRP